jgi:penicillin-binding protein 2
VRAQLISLLAEGDQAQGRFRATYSSEAVGEFEREGQIALSLEDSEWRILWTPALVIPELHEGDTLEILYQPSVRGNIYDRADHALAAHDTQVTVGVVPALIGDETAMLASLSRILGMAPTEIQEKYQHAQRPDWFMPIADITPEQNQAYYDELTQLPGVQMREKLRRAYPDGALFAHVVGYLGEISEEELKTWHSRGYQSGDLVGKSGLEAWAEAYLAGQKGTQLAVVSSTGQVRTILAQRPAVHSRNVVVTLDTDLQKAAAEALGERLGAIVALDPRDGSVLAMVTYPSFNPKDFTGGISAETWNQLTTDPRRPLLNRALQGTYPPGSIFKVVTMAAGLEDAAYAPDSTFTCTGVWTGLGEDWKKTCYNKAGHGALDLVRGLTQSCDVVFYTLGKALYDAAPQALSDMARGFGLGAPTGIDLPGEASGLVPDEAWKTAAKGEGWYPGDNVNLAIGQGDLLVTPLQMAALYGAIANGGTLYRPHVVANIPAWTEGEQDIVVQPEVIGHLPVSEEHLAAIRQGLEGVTQPPYGTSWKVFEGMPISVAGKSGTAENNFELPHSWWVGYAPVDDPQIVVVAVVENIGEGSQFAGPTVRQVIEAWYQLTLERSAGQ